MKPWKPGEDMPLPGTPIQAVGGPCVPDQFGDLIPLFAGCWVVVTLASHRVQVLTDTLFKLTHEEF